MKSLLGMRWMLRALVFIWVLLLLNQALAWVGNRDFFAIRKIEIRGDLQHYNEQTLRLHLLPELKGNFFSIDLMQTQAAFQKLPWVRKAWIQRAFPNGLRVTLEEHQAAAYWGPQLQDDSSELMNHFGEIFEASLADEDAPPPLPRLSGPIESAVQIWNMYLHLSHLFHTNMRVKVSELTLSPHGSWRTKIAPYSGHSQAWIELGRGDNALVLERAQRFVLSLPQAQSKHFLNKAHVFNPGSAPLFLSADLRHNNAYAVRWLEGPAPTSAAAIASTASKPDSSKLSVKQEKQNGQGI